MDAATAGSAPDPSRDEESPGISGSDSKSDGKAEGLPEVIPIDPAGDLILDVTFETSRSTLRAAARHPKRQPGSVSSSASGPGSAGVRRPQPQSHSSLTSAKPEGDGPQVVRLAFRVEAAALRRHSRYFDALLGDARFREAREVAAALEALALKSNGSGDGHIRDADPADLPRVAVVDDDQATRYARREGPFADLLRVLHGVEVVGGVRAAAAAGAGADIAVQDKQAPGKQQQQHQQGDETLSTPPRELRQQVGPLGVKTGAPGHRQQQQQKKAAVAPKVPPNKKQPHQQKQQQPQQKKKTKEASSDASHPARQNQGQRPAVVLDMPYVTTLAVLADRFDCTVAVSRWLMSGASSKGAGAGAVVGAGTTAERPRIRWPATSTLPTGRGGAGDDAMGPSMGLAAEEALRQKVLVSWVLDLPARFSAATREIIMNGSSRWGVLGYDCGGGYEGWSGEAGEGLVDGGDEDGQEAIWWYLPDGLEEELQYRRHCILNTVASIQQHFLALYASRGGGSGGRQCKLGYDSSAACDSYQLGEMVKFLAHKGLLGLVDFSPRSLIGGGGGGGGAVGISLSSSSSLAPVDAILAALRQCPAYQVDKHHSNCGLRTRLLPLLDFLQGLLSAGSVPLARAVWKKDRAAAAWLPRPRGGGPAAAGDDDGDPRPFRFTRSMLGDQRLRFEHALGAERFAREVFTASSWDWTAED